MQPNAPEGPDPGKFSSFNSGTYTIWRLHNLWTAANAASFQKNLMEWNDLLLILMREVSSKLSKKELNHLITQRQKISPLLLTYTATQNHPSQSNRAKTDLYNALHEFEMTLRYLTDHHGMGLPDRQDPSSILGGGLN